jgi:hypothetical protein
MKSFREWQGYTPSIDGPPLEPHTISGAEVQIKQLASHIRTSFNLDDRWTQYHQQIAQAAELLNQAADLLGRVMTSSERNTPHKYHQ